MKIKNLFSQNNSPTEDTSRWAHKSSSATTPLKRTRKSHLEQQLEVSINNARQLLERSRNLVNMPNALPLIPKSREKIHPRKTRYTLPDIVEKAPTKLPPTEDAQVALTINTRRQTFDGAITSSISSSSRSRLKYHVQNVEEKLIVDCERSLKAKQNRERVLALNIKRQEQRRRTILSKIESRELRHSNAMRRRAEATLCRTWLGHLAVTAVMNKMITLFVRHRMQLQMNYLLNRMALRIQRKYREIRARVHGARRLRLWMVLRPILWKIHLQHRCIRRRKRISIIRKFIQAYTRQTQIRNVMQHFRFQVVKIQRYVRSFLRVQRSRRRLLTRLWDKVELSERRILRQIAQDELNKSLPMHKQIVKSKVEKERAKAKANTDAVSMSAAGAQWNPFIRRKRLLNYGNQAQKSNRSDIELNSLVRSVVWKFQKAVDAQSCVLYLRNAATKQLTFRFSEHAGEQLVDEHLGLAGYVATTGTPVKLKHAFKDPRFNPAVDRVSGKTAGSFLCLPVKYDGTLLAVCQMANKTSGPEFTFEDESLLAACCSHLGQALMALNARAALKSKQTALEDEKVIHPMELKARRDREKEKAREWSEAVEASQQELMEVLEGYVKEKNQGEKLQIDRHRKKNRYGRLSISQWLKKIDALSGAMNAEQCIYVEEKDKVAHIHKLLRDARRKWMGYATSKYGALGRKRLKSAKMDLNDAKHLLHGNPNKLPLTRAQVQWPPFLLLGQNVAAKIRAILFEAELHRLRQTEGLEEGRAVNLTAALYRNASAEAFSVEQFPRHSLALRLVGMATFTDESRFGIDFIAKKAIDPSPVAYDPQAAENLIKHKPSSKLGSFSLAKRTQIGGSIGGDSPGPLGYNAKKPGEFPKTYNAKDIKAQKDMDRTIQDLKPAKQPTIFPTDKYPLTALKHGIGPGDYNTDKDRNEPKISTLCSFGNSKRMGIIEFMKTQGEHGFSPGPASYFPKNLDISNEAVNKHDVKRLLARARQNDTLLSEAFSSLEVKKSAKQFQKSFHKLSKSYSTPQMWSNYERIKKAPDFREPGPGQYDTGTDFKFKAQPVGKSTFGKARRRDLLTAMQEAGHVSISGLGPGEYKTRRGSFGNNTKNARCGYKQGSSSDSPPQIETHRRDKKKSGASQSPVPAPSEELFRALMAPPDFKKLGYQNHLLKPSPAPTKKRSRVAKKAKKGNGDTQRESISKQSEKDNDKPGTKKTIDNVVQLRREDTPASEISDNAKPEMDEHKNMHRTDSAILKVSTTTRPLPKTPQSPAGSNRPLPVQSRPKPTTPQSPSGGRPRPAGSRPIPSGEKE